MWAGQTRKADTESLTSTVDPLQFHRLEGYLYAVHTAPMEPRHVSAQPLEALTQSVRDDWQGDCRVGEALGHFRLTIVLAPALSFLEGGTTQPSPLRHIRSELNRVVMRMIMACLVTRDDGGLLYEVLRCSAADYYHGRVPRFLSNP